MVVGFFCRVFRGISLTPSEGCLSVFHDSPLPHSCFCRKKRQLLRLSRVKDIKQSFRCSLLT